MTFETFVLVVFFWFVIGALNCAFLQNAYTITNHQASRESIIKEPHKFAVFFLEINVLTS
jgi:hypothetical protein